MPASPRHALLAENLGKPSLWVIINEIWYYNVQAAVDIEHHLIVTHFDAGHENHRYAPADPSDGGIGPSLALADDPLKGPS